MKVVRNSSLHLIFLWTRLHAATRVTEMLFFYAWGENLLLLLEAIVYFIFNALRQRTRNTTKMTQFEAYGTRNSEKAETEPLGWRWSNKRSRLRGGGGEGGQECPNSLMSPYHRTPTSAAGADKHVTFSLSCLFSSLFFILWAVIAMETLCLQKKKKKTPPE